MKLGVEDMWGDSLDHYRKILQLVNELDYDIVGVGDGPAGWHDLYVTLTLAAMETEKAIITPFVTSPFLRHPLVVANAFSSLQDLSGGRMVLGLARGGGNVFSVGRRPANLKEVNEYWDALDGLFAGNPIQWEDRPVFPLHYARKTPIMYSAFGPKAFKLAAERADGVIMFTDGDLSQTEEKIHGFRKAARDAGRNPEELEIWVTAFCSIGETREKAIDDIKAYLVTNVLTFLNTPDKMANVPEHLKPQLLALGEEYDQTEHVVVNGKNAQALDRAGPELAELLTSIHTVAGTPNEVKTIIDGLDDLGVTAFITNTSGHADPFNHLKELAKLVKG